MAVVATADVELRANMAKFERDVKSQVTKAASRVSADVKGIAPPTNLIGKFSAAVDRADKGLQRFGLTSRDVSVILGAGLAGGVAFALRSLIQFASVSVQAAANLEDVRNRARIVFGDASSSVEAFAATATESLGQSERAALEAASTFGTLAKGVGLTEPVAAQVAETLTRLASDTRSFIGGQVDAATAANAFRRALVGEFDPLETLGITIRAADIEGEALRLGLIRQGEELDGLTRFLATYSLILSKTTDQQGDFGRTLDSLPNQTQTFTAQVEELQAAIGEFLLPSVAATVNQFNDLFGLLERGLTTLDDSANAWIHLGQTIADNAANAIERALDAVGIHFGEIKDLTNEQLKAAAELGGPLGDLAKAELRHRDAAKEAATAEGVIADSATQAALAHRRFAVAIDAAQKASSKLETTLASIEDAQEASQRSIEDAERSLQRTIRDSAERNAAAAQHLQDAEASAARSIEDAQRRVTEAHQDAADAIEQASERVVDAQQRVADAERSLARTRIDVARDVAEAQQRLDDLLSRQRPETIRQRRLREIAEAEQNLKDVQAKGSERLLDAERSVADARKQLAEDEKNLAQTRVESAQRIADAQRELADAEAKAARDIADARTALARTIRNSAESIQDAQRDVARAHDAAADAERKQKAELDKLIKTLRVDAHDALGVHLRDLLDAAAATEDLTEKLRLLDEFQRRSAANTPFPIGVAPIHFQHGGSIVPGHPSLVGERGPELRTFDAPGQIISNDRILQALSQAVGPANHSRTMTNTWHISGAGADPEAIFQAIAARLGMRFRR